MGGPQIEFYLLLAVSLLHMSLTVIQTIAIEYLRRRYPRKEGAQEPEPAPLPIPTEYRRIDRSHRSRPED